MPPADPFEQTPDDDLIAALNEGIQYMRGTETVAAFSQLNLAAKLARRVVRDGPYVRDLPDGRRQFYAFVAR